MKTIILLCLLVAVATAVPVEKYEDKDDGVDVEEILANRRLLVPYVKCALDQGKCSAAAKDMRDHIREALETDCEKCTDKQKKNSKLVFKHLINKEKDYWTQLVVKYDAKREFAPKYEKMYLGKA